MLGQVRLELRIRACVRLRRVLDRGQRRNSVAELRCEPLISFSRAGQCAFLCFTRAPRFNEHLLRTRVELLACLLLRGRDFQGMCFRGSPFRTLAFELRRKRLAQRLLPQELVFRVAERTRERLQLLIEIGAPAFGIRDGLGLSCRRLLELRKRIERGAMRVPLARELQLHLSATLLFSRELGFEHFAHLGVSLQLFPELAKRRRELLQAVFVIRTLPEPVCDFLGLGRRRSVHVGQQLARDLLCSRVELDLVLGLFPHARFRRKLRFEVGMRQSVPVGGLLLLIERSLQLLNMNREFLELCLRFLSLRFELRLDSSACELVVIGGLLGAFDRCRQFSQSAFQRLLCGAGLELSFRQLSLQLGIGMDLLLERLLRGARLRLLGCELLLQRRGFARVLDDGVLRPAQLLRCSRKRVLQFALVLCLSVQRLVCSAAFLTLACKLFLDLDSLAHVARNGFLRRTLFLPGRGKLLLKLGFALRLAFEPLLRLARLVAFVLQLLLELPLRSALRSTVSCTSRVLLCSRASSCCTSASAGACRARGHPASRAIAPAAAPPPARDLRAPARVRSARLSRLRLGAGTPEVLGFEPIDARLRIREQA